MMKERHKLRKSTNAYLILIKKWHWSLVNSSDLELSNYFEYALVKRFHQVL